MSFKNKWIMILFAFFMLMMQWNRVKAKSSPKSNTSISVRNNNIYIFHGQELLLKIDAIDFNFVAPISLNLEGNKSNGYDITAVYPAVAKYRNSNSRLKIKIKVTIMNGSVHFYANPSWAHNVTIHLADRDEHYFGVLERLYPDNIKSPDLTGDVVPVDILGNGDQYHENYSDAWSAFFMSNKGYASFYDTFAKGIYRFGKNEETELYHHTGKLNWYVIPGKNGDQMLSKYYKIIGNPKYIPIWACGPIVWRDQNNGGAKEILSDIQHMTDLKIPLTGWFVDRPYSNGADEWSKMDFNSKFADPAKWIGEINHKYGLQFMTWVGSLTFSDKKFPRLLPNYKGYIDLTNPKADNEFERRLTKNQYAYNVRGHKMDRGDEEFPEMAKWYNHTPRAEHRNKYIYLYAKEINKFLKDSFGKDQFNFARAAFQRSQPYLSAVWNGDSRSNWDGLASSIATAVRTGFIGFPMWGSDVGGYLGGRIPTKLYARWLDFGSWSGMFEIKIDNAGGRGQDRPPWKYGKDLQEAFRNACNHRMKMLPYIYSLLNTSYKNGVLMKPLAFKYLKDKNTYNIWNEYLYGDAFLVAPIYSTKDTRQVYLPAGTWYDYHNWSSSYQGNRTIQASTDLNHIPVFVKTNSIFVTGNIYQGNDKNWQKTKNLYSIEVTTIPGESGERTSFTYVDRFDHDIHKKFSMNSESKSVTIHLDPVQSKINLHVKLKQKPKSVRVDHRRVRIHWNRTDEMLSVSLHKGHKYTIKVLKKKTY